MFQPLENIRPFLKMALEGFAGDGKTFTATQVAIGLHKKIGSKKPIAILDTEAASKALLPLFKREGIQAVVSEARSLSAVNQAIKWCESGNADILIIDSITHIWEEFLTAYKQSKRYNKTFLEFQDWGVIKPRWKAEFSTPFVKAKCHIIFTGRAAYEYDFLEQVQGATGKVKKEIHKSGIKMKAEGETAFEPDILILMEKKKDLLGNVKKIWREATILKDRTNTIDGETIKNPSFEAFEPAINLLLDGVCKDIDADQPQDLFQHEDTDYIAQRKKREGLIDEIEGCFSLMELGTGKEEKLYKAAILKAVFAVTSTKSLENINLDTLEGGFTTVKNVADDYHKLLSGWKLEGQKPDLTRIQEIVKQHNELPI